MTLESLHAPAVCCSAWFGALSLPPVQGSEVSDRDGDPIPYPFPALDAVPHQTGDQKCRNTKQDVGVQVFPPNERISSPFRGRRRYLGTARRRGAISHRLVPSGSPPNIKLTGEAVLQCA